MKRAILGAVMAAAASLLVRHYTRKTERGHGAPRYYVDANELVNVSTGARAAFSSPEMAQWGKHRMERGADPSELIWTLPTGDDDREG